MLVNDLYENCCVVAEKAHEFAVDHGGGGFCLFLRKGAKKGVDLFEVGEIDVPDLRAHVIVSKCKRGWRIRMDYHTTTCKDDKLHTAILCAFRRDLTHRYGGRKFIF